jgi:choline kinase
VPTAGPGSSISEFLLDSGTLGDGGPGMARNYAEEEALRERQAEGVVEELVEETRLWRVANSAQWVAWGIVQAKDPGLDFLRQAGAGGSEVVQSSKHIDGPQYRIGDAKQQDHNISTPLDNYAEGRGADGAEDDEDEFDYLAYAQDRARFFWGDCVELGLVREEELPVNLRRSLKRVPY